MIFTGGIKTSCSELHFQKVFQFKVLSYKICWPRGNDQVKPNVDHVKPFADGIVLLFSWQTDRTAENLDPPNFKICRIWAG